MYRYLCCRSFLDETGTRQDGGSSLKLVLCMLDYNEWSSHPKTKKPRKKKWGLSSLLLIVFAGTYNVSILKFAAALELVFCSLIGLYLFVCMLGLCLLLLGHMFKMLTPNLYNTIFLDYWLCSSFLTPSSTKEGKWSKFEAGRNVDTSQTNNTT